MGLRSCAVRHSLTVRSINAAEIQAKCLALNRPLGDHLLNNGRIVDIRGVGADTHDTEVVEGARFRNTKLLSFYGGGWEEVSLKAYQSADSESLSPKRGEC